MGTSPSKNDRSRNKAYDEREVNGYDYNIKAKEYTFRHTTFGYPRREYNDLTLHGPFKNEDFPKHKNLCDNFKKLRKSLLSLNKKEVTFMNYIQNKEGLPGGNLFVWNIKKKF